MIVVTAVATQASAPPQQHTSSTLPPSAGTASPATVVTTAVATATHTTDATTDAVASAERALSAPVHLLAPVLAQPPGESVAVPMGATRVVMHQIVLPAECDTLGICFGGQVRHRR